MKTAEDIRRVLEARYADSEDDSASVHPMIAITVVLISAVLIDTTDVDQLVEFTSYSKPFVAAIAANMLNSELWKDGKYRARCSHDRNLLPRNEGEANQLWDDIESAAWAQAKELLVGLAKNLVYGSCYEINGETDLEVPDFVPTRCELFQLAKYYGFQSVQVSFDTFIGAATGSAEWKIKTFSNCRLGQIATLLGLENVDTAYAQGEKEFKKSRSISDDWRNWRVFKYGTKEERDALHEELQDLYDRADTEDSEQ